MDQGATFLIAQHVPDPFRREPRNVGVFVRMGEEASARFFGETESALLDSRKTKVLPFPDVYLQWVKYWRRVISQRSVEDAWSEIKVTAKEHYQVVDGGMVDGIASDSIDDVVRYLYAALVSEGGIASALGAPDETEAAVRLADAVEDNLRQNGLLFNQRETMFGVKYPVKRDVPVVGKATIHTMSFVQRNGHAVVMEPIDLAVKRDKKRMKERAGWASRVFEDVKSHDSSTEAIALISASPEEARDKDAVYSLALLKDCANDIINWQSPEDRARFLSARAALAAAV